MNEAAYLQEGVEIWDKDQDQHPSVFEKCGENETEED